MPECGNCGRHVSMDYHRVFADRAGVLDGCPNCTRASTAGREPSPA